MNALEVAAMLDKIKDLGGSVKLMDGKPVAHKIPPNLMPLLISNRDMVIRVLSGKHQAPKPLLHKRASLDYKLSTGKGGSISGTDDDTESTLLAALLEKWPNELVGVTSDGVRVWP